MVVGPRLGLGRLVGLATMRVPVTGLDQGAGLHWGERRAESWSERVGLGAIAIRSQVMSATLPRPPSGLKEASPEKNDARHGGQHAPIRS